MSDTSLTSEAPASQELEASAKVLTLPVGVYAFSVQGGATTISADGLTLPALQLGLAPIGSQGAVEFLAGAGTLDRWLISSSDAFIVRISESSVSLLLTSVRLPSSPLLTINVQRIDAGAVPINPELQSSQEVSDGAEGVPVQIMAHIENFGDIYFNDGRAGFLDQKLRIEAFALLSVGQMDPNSIEYCAVTADGRQTPWLSDQILCGSRGQAMPLTGYAFRLKPEVSSRYECAYTGKFLSGTVVGPLKEGEICHSHLPGDPLETMELRVTERVISEPKTGQEIEYSDVN